MRFFVAALMICLLAVTSADARSRQKKIKHSRGDSLAVSLLKKQLAETAALRRELADIRRLLRPQIASLDPEPLLPEPPRNPLVAIAPMPIPDATKTLKGYEKYIARSAKLKDLTPKLAVKVAEIMQTCPGARLTSGYRRGARVAGSGRPSLHSRYPSRAADMAGNPACIRRKLVGWKGGLSTDYAAVRHYHVSYEPRGREWGRRFAHYGSRKARHHRRYAQAR